MNLASKYPHDRIVFFSDAVFAIAITLLVIEIKVPGHDVIHELGTAAALKKLIPLFIGFIVSFLVTALFWKAHLQLCTHIPVFNARLIWTNIFVLLFVALMPFSTALYSENFGDNVSFSFYCMNLAMIGFCNFWMTYQVTTMFNLKEKMTPLEVHWMRGRALAVPVVFLSCIGLVAISPLMGRFGFVLIFIIQMAGDRIVSRRMTAAT